MMPRVERTGLPALIVCLALSGASLQAETRKCGDVSAGETWLAADGPFVLTCQVNVPTGITLTISPGTVVKATAFAGCGLQVSGTLIADAGSTSPADRIYFTSLRDDSVAGDTNNDGPSAGAGGDWGGIFFSDGSAGNRLNNVAVRFGGGNGWGLYQAAANITSASRFVTITNSELSSSLSQAVYLTPTASEGASIQSTQAINNPINGLFVFENSNPMTEPAGTWGASLPYVLNGVVTVPTGVSLKIAAGTVVKPAAVSAGYGLQVNGSLIADGTAGRIHFTSILDDSVGGDTSNNGATSPSPGDWGGIFFNDGSTGNRLNNVEIRYGGGNSWGFSDAFANITSGSPSLSITNSTITRSSRAGLYVTGSGASADVTAVRFVLNDVGISFNGGSSGNVTQSAFVGQRDGVSIDSSSHPTLGVQENAQDPSKPGGNTFVCNHRWHVCSANPAPTPAQRNWWGSAPPDPNKFCDTTNLDLANSLAAETTAEAEAPGGARAPALAELRVTRGQAPASLHLTWEEIAPGPEPGCGYDVFRGTSLRPKDLTCISGPGGLQAASFDDDSGVGPEDPHYYSVYVHWKCP